MNTRKNEQKYYKILQEAPLVDQAMVMSLCDVGEFETLTNL